MSRVLILFAHPLLEKSRVHNELLAQARGISGVTINDLYQAYPDFNIDVAAEKQLLLSHDIIIWQHPFYWYSAPPLLKQWQDIVLEHGWAYGKKGFALKDKKVISVLSSGGGMAVYQYGGYNKYPIHDFLRPFERTAELCRMLYLPPFWIGGVHKLEPGQIKEYAVQYRNLLFALTGDVFTDEELLAPSLLNDLFPVNSSQL